MTNRLALLMTWIIMFLCLVVVLLGDSCPAQSAEDSDGAVIGIDYAHYKIHQGEHYYYSNGVSLATGASVVVHVKIPAGATTAHLFGIVQTTASSEIYFIDGGTYTNDGTSVVERNRNRVVGDGSNVTEVFTAPTVSGGDTIYTAFVGDNKIPGERREDNEHILKPGNSYRLKIKSNANGNIISTLLDWYEED